MNFKYIVSYYVDKCIKPLFGAVGMLLVKIKVLDKFIIIKMDGGLCSQMHFYMIGKYFEDKSYKVKYNTDFFKLFGLDANRQYSRNFDLLKAFPDLCFVEASKLDCLLYSAFSYKNNYSVSTLDFSQIEPPRLLNGYYKDFEGFYHDFFCFHINENVLDIANKEVLKSIKEKANPVAIHVRRGDLSGYNPTYGPPVDFDYFNRAIAYVEEHTGKGYYYFFSDDIDWVKTSLIGYLCIDSNYTIIDINGSDKGYMDLFLMASCNHQISSKGSFGKYAGFLKHDDSNIITVYDDEYERNIWEGQSNNIVFI